MGSALEVSGKARRAVAGSKTLCLFSLGEQLP